MCHSSMERPSGVLPIVSSFSHLLPAIDFRSTAKCSFVYGGTCATQSVSDVGVIRSVSFGSLAS